MNLEKPFDFTGRTIVVSGGTGVLGGEICGALVRCGAEVVVLARDTAKWAALEKRLAGGPGSGKMVYADVLNKESLIQARESLAAGSGRVYGLINAAGGNFPQATTGPDRTFFDLPEDALRQVMDLNLLGTVFASQVFGSLMVAAGEGIIINVTSMSADRPLTRVASYSASKAAVTNFTQWLAVHMAVQYSPRIRVNAVSPGFFHTSQNHFLLYDEKTGDLTPRGKSIVAHTPMGRFGKPEDLLGAVLWLLSPAADFVTGAVIAIDGGFSAFSGV
jgi:NAD(P)-dependent dehydrogenase (short-subunit alcohol dehydrogenase family)